MLITLGGDGIFRSNFVNKCINWEIRKSYIFRPCFLNSVLLFGPYINLFIVGLLCWKLKWQYPFSGFDCQFIQGNWREFCIRNCTVWSILFFWLFFFLFWKEPTFISCFNIQQELITIHSPRVVHITINEFDTLTTSLYLCTINRINRCIICFLFCLKRRLWLLIRTASIFLAEFRKQP